MSQLILVPTDLSKNSLRALDYAVKLAIVMKARIEVLHIYRVYSEEKNSLLAALLYGDTDIKKAVEKKLYNLVKKYSKKVKINFAAIDGLAAASITDHADAIKAGLIVMSRSNAA